MALKYTKWPLNIPNGYNIYQHWNFWFENKPSSNPDWALYYLVNLRQALFRFAPLSAQQTLFTSLTSPCCILFTSYHCNSQITICNLKWSTIFVVPFNQKDSQCLQQRCQIFFGATYQNGGKYTK
jgi:hypothetical protein